MFSVVSREVDSLPILNHQVELGQNLVINYI